MSTQSLPRGTTEIVGSSATGIRKRLLEEIQLGKGGQYVLVTNVSPDLVEQSIDKRVDVFGCKCQITYDADTRRMIVKLPGGPHEISSGFFDLEIAYQTQLMNLAHALKATRSKTHKHGSYIKEPDSCFRPRVLPPGRSIKWPTLVLECGWAESLRHLRMDADWWISHSNGEVKAVIIASIKKDPYKLHIERYSGVQPETRARTRYAKALEQTVKVYRASNGIIETVGHPLIIPFEQVMLRTSNGPPEGDFIFDQANLIAMAIDVWDEPV
ncbi:hypothetical protein BDV36DRAFT_278866 [Aspergillus pseudocaelatus]|uniref:Fungal-type protein kinase domain-containing protein n=1 Tax=Aspergillus pseudocaelatus TaxID=1825620 RepID=A0ABQ6X4P8_9EURO|nr:hypothetical protein BDV36DRAFT_278866 [Aspergillus pseudocaelatus]